MLQQNVATKCCNKMLQQCCNNVATMLQQCCNKMLQQNVATMLQQCCNIVATMLCFGVVRVKMLQQCCNIVATMLRFGVVRVKMLQHCCNNVAVWSNAVFQKCMHFSQYPGAVDVLGVTHVSQQQIIFQRGMPHRQPASTTIFFHTTTPIPSNVEKYSGAWRLPK